MDDAVREVDVLADEERRLLVLAVVDIPPLGVDVDPGREVIARKGRQREFQHQVRAGHLGAADDVVTKQEVDLVGRHLFDRIVVGLLLQVGLHGGIVRHEAGELPVAEIHGIVQVDLPEHGDPHRKFGLAGKPLADGLFVVRAEHLILVRVVAAAQQQHTRYDCYYFTHKVHFCRFGYR